MTCPFCRTHYCVLCGDKYPPNVPRELHHLGNYYANSCKTLDARNGVSHREVAIVDTVIAMGIPREDVMAGLDLERRRLENQHAIRPPFNQNP
jgi:hypothetical protein